MDWTLPRIVFFVTNTTPKDSSLFPLWIAMAGALLGGGISFSTTFFFHWWDRRRKRIQLSWAFYVSLMKVFNDVHAVSSRYFDALGNDVWDIEPWTRMPELLGESDLRYEIAPDLLSSIYGPHAKGLVNDVLEQVNFRNFILAAAVELSERKARLMNAVADNSDLGPGMSMTTKLDPKTDKALIMEVKTLDDLAKQLLAMLLQFEDRQANLSIRYNTFTANHPLKTVRGFKAEFQSRRPWHTNLPTVTAPP